MTLFALALVAVWLTVKGWKAESFGYCQLFSLAAGVAWGAFSVMVLNLWLSH